MVIGFRSITITYALISTIRRETDEVRCRDAGRVRVNVPDQTGRVGVAGGNVSASGLAG